MSDKRISQLVERVTIANNDVLPIVALNAATTNKVTISTIQDWMQTHMDLGVTSISVNTSTSGSDITISGSPITSTGTITINIPTASATNRGALSSTDWSTFNGKQDVLTFYSPLQKNGVSVTIDQADTDTSGYLSFTDWNTFNNKEGALTKGNLTETISGVLTITGGTAAVIGTGTTIEVKQASGSQDGFLDSADWTTFNNKVSTSRSISTTAPLQGGGDLSANRTLSITQSGSASNGYLSSTDWNTFNNKQDYLSGTGVVKSTAGTISYINGLATQYIDGTGSLQTFPSIIGTANNLTREVYNETGATLVKGTVVYINGGHGNLPTITKALATGDSTSAQTYGVVQTDIGDMSNGYIVVIGDLFDMPTNGYLTGTQLYLSSTTAGEFTSTKQYAPAHLVYVGIVTRSHPTQGVIAVKIQNGFEMDELHNVSAQNPSNNDILQFKTATNLWTKVAGSTTNIAEGTNLYYTDARSRGAFSESVTGLDYNSTTGVLSTTAGYGIPTTASQSNWDAAYNDKINSAAVTGTTTKTLTLTQQDGGTITASWTDINTDAVSSVFGRTGAVVAVSGDYNTDLVTEGTTNKYFTNGRARTAISLTTTGTSGAATYNDVTGVLNIPSYVGGVTSVFGRTGAVVAASGDYTTAQVTESGNLYFTDARARAAISLTTTGTSGAATYSGGVLNIPNYSTDLSGYVTLSTDQTIGGAKNFTSGQMTMSSHYYTNMYGVSDVYVHFYPSGGNGANYSAVNWRFWQGVGQPSKVLYAAGNGNFTWDDYKIYHAGNSNTITSLGTITTGVWNGTAIADGYLANTYAIGLAANINTNTAINANTRRNGMYRVDNGVTNSPDSGSYFSLIEYGNQDNVVGQLASQFSTGETYIRAYNASWSAWRKLWDNVNLPSPQSAITLTTTGTSGVATFSSNTLNIPNYGSALGNYLPLAGGTLTGPLNGTTAVFGTSVLSADFRYEGSGYLTYNTSAGSTNTFALRNNGTSVLGIDASNNATFASNVTARQLLLSTSYNVYTYNDQFELRNEGVWRFRLQSHHNGGGYDYRIVQNNNGTDVNVMTFINGNIDVIQAATFSSSITASGVITGSNGINVGANALGTDRMFQVSGTSFTSGTTQFGAVYNPSFSGTITNVYGIYVGNNFSSGTITNSYNLYIEGTSAGSATITNRWGIYQAGGSDRNYFAGLVGINNTNPQARLDLGGGYGASGEKFFIYNDNNAGALAGTKVGFYMDRFGLSNNSTYVFPTHADAPGSYIISSKDTSTTTLVARISVFGQSGYVGIGTGAANPYSQLEVQATDSSGARTSPIDVLTITAENPSNPYNGFGATLLFRNRIYAGGPTPGGMRNGARIRTSINNNSSADLGTELVFDVTTTGAGALTEILRLGYDNGVVIQNKTTINHTLFVTSGRSNSAQFKGDGAFDGSNTVSITNNAYIYGRNNLVLTGRLDNSNDGYSFGSNARNSIVFNVNEGGAQGAGGTEYYGMQLQLVTKALYFQSKYGNDNGLAGFVFSSDNQLRIRNTTSYGDYALQVTGAIYSSADIIAYSDISVKKNIRPIENALERVTKSRGVLYDRKDIDSKDNIGFIAQELEVEFPELISLNEDGTKGVKYQNAVAVLFEAVKEQQKQINELKKRN